MMNNSVHIGEKILQKVQPILEVEYGIYFDPTGWDLFKKPFGKPTCLFLNSIRQEDALKIIDNILSVYGKNIIINFMNALAKIEPNIQKLQPLVRDHIVHAVNTFILGIYILESVELPSDQKLTSLMWNICGPTHDLGYPIEIAFRVSEEFVNRYNSILGNLGTSSPTIFSSLFPNNLDLLCGGRSAKDIIQKRLDEWDLDLNLSDYFHWLCTNNATDHGVISALAQIKIIDALYNKYNPNGLRQEMKRRYDNAEYDFNQDYFDRDIVSSSAALIIHNIDKDYNGFSNKISFQIAPLAFLLFLCDTFQEWDRYAEGRPMYSGDEFGIHCEKNSISLIVPDDKNSDVSGALAKRLSGLLINVNGDEVVSP